MNLAETQGLAKKVIIILVALTILYYIGKYIILGGVGLYYILIPQKAIEPAAAFGPVPQLVMTSVPIEGNPTYILDTINGNLPQFSDRAYVYTITQPTPTLLSEQKIKQLAKDLHFTGDYTKQTTSDFRWIDGTYNRSMNANAITTHFRVQTQLNVLEKALAETASITAIDAINQAKSFIQSKGLMSSADLANLSFRTYPSQISLGRMKETTNLTGTSKITKVDITRSIIDPSSKTLNIVLGPNPRNSLITLHVTNNPSVYKTPIINFTYWPANYEEGSTYYLSSIQAVWDTIKNGQGVIAYVRPSDEDYYDSHNNTTISQIEIREVYLAYYEQKEYAPYLQPIYVFEGKFISDPNDPYEQPGDIIIYYPAIRGDFVK